MSQNIRKLPFFKPYIRSAELKAVRKILKSGWLTTGPESRAFEKEFASYLESGSSDKPEITALAVNSATSGLHMALEAAGVGNGDIVAVPSMTFTATAEVVRYFGADPLFIDSSPHTGNMDPNLLKEAIAELGTKKDRLKAVIVVHLAGLPCDMKAIRNSLQNCTVTVIEDAAHSFPSHTGDGMAGTLGDIGVFSFYATKTITTGEGGMVVTRNTEFAKRMHIMRLHGIDRPVWNRYSSEAEAASWEYDVVEAGFKYNLTDMAASLGRVQLKRADYLLETRRRIASQYDQAFSTLPELKIPPRGEGHAHHLYLLGTVNKNVRDQLIAKLAAEGIGTSVHFIPLHRMTYWKTRYKLNPADFPTAEIMANTNLSLPIWPGMKNRDIKRVIAVVKKALDG